MNTFYLVLQDYRFLAEWLTGIGTLLLAIATVFVAVVWPLIDEKRRKPILDLSITPAPPDCHKVPITDTQTRLFLANSYYLRLLVANMGSRPAENVEVFMAGLLRKRADGTFARVESFLPMNLQWSHVHGAFFPRIAKGVPKHCDLAHIIHPEKRETDRRLSHEKNPNLGLEKDQTNLSFDLIVRPNTLSHLQPPGTYRIPLIASASNAEPIRCCVELTLTGKWYGDESEMLAEGKGVSISLVDPDFCSSNNR